MTEDGYEAWGLTKRDAKGEARCIACGVWPPRVDEKVTFHGSRWVCLRFFSSPSGLHVHRYRYCTRCQFGVERTAAVGTRGLGEVS